MIDWRRTTRGFVVGHFEDVNGQPCTIQQSANAGALWLGTGMRMHLDMDRAREIALVLKRFAETGRLE